MMKRSSLDGSTVVRAQPRAILRLLGAFELTWDGEPVSLPLPAQRLVAFLALRERPVVRAHVAETLWLDSTEERACGSLRSALWRLRRPGHELVDVTNGRLWLAPAVVVDVRLLVGWTRGVLDAPDRVGVVPPGASGLEAGLAAVNAEPLRESAHRSLIGVYLAEGNQAEALRSYRVYRDLLRDQLGLEPSARMDELVRGLLVR